MNEAVSGTGKLYDAKTIARALGCAKKTVLERAKREGWAVIQVTGIGGRRNIYNVDTAHADVRHALRKLKCSEAKAAPQDMAMIQRLVERRVVAMFASPLRRAIRAALRETRSK